MIQYYVTTDGNDSWSGKLAEPGAGGSDGPFATVPRAQEAVRALRVQGRLTEPVTVWVRGLHRLDAPLVFTPEDAGTNDCSVTYAGIPGGTSILSGGRVITGWTKGPGALWTAQVPAGCRSFRQLFVNGRRVPRSRHPNTGYLRVAGLVEDKPDAPWREGVTRFRFHPGDLKRWQNLEEVEVVVFHAWNISRVRIKSIDEQAGIVTFATPTNFRPLAWDPDQRYYVENAVELVDAPDEWHIDGRTGVLTCWAPEGEDLTRAEVVVPVLSELVRFEGNPDAGNCIHDLHFRDISFQHADWTLPAAGYGDSQAAWTVPAAIMGKGLVACSLIGCEIAHVGIYGLWFSRGCRDNQILRNHIHDLGAGGIKLGEAGMAERDEAESCRNLVSNNYIHDGGHVYPEGVGVWISQTSGNKISHNEIHDFNYTGISIGWNWDERPNRTHHNILEYNHIHHLLRGMLSDGAGIYSLGTQIGTVFRNNRIHDIFPYTGLNRTAPHATLRGGELAMGWCIYLDQGSSGITVENNICYNTLNGGMMNTGSVGNVIRNNILALSAWSGVWRFAWQHEPSSVFRNNIIWLTQGELFHLDGGREDFKSQWNYNLYWRTDGRELLFYTSTFAEWTANGVDTHSRVADPLFTDPLNGDFSLRPESPAYELGFVAIDMSRTGLYGSPEWVNLPRQAKFAPTKLPPPLPPVTRPALSVSRRASP